MRQYRVVEVMDGAGHVRYAVQRKWLLFWKHADFYDGWENVKTHDYRNTKEQAIEVVHNLVRKDQERSALNNKIAAHKNKVVYGPYPP